MYLQRSLLLVVTLCLIQFSTSQKYDWTPVDQVLQKHIQLNTYPGCTAAIFGENGILYAKAFGNFTYGAVPPRNTGNPLMTLTTQFDMASLTKVVVTTTAIMQFYQRGELDIDTRISDILGSRFSAAGKGTITVRNILLHNAGFPADPEPGYSSSTFACPETSNYHPAEVFTCQKQIYDSLMNQVLVNPVGAVYIYSDLSMITGMYVVGHLARQYGKVSSSDLNPACISGWNLQSPEVAQCYYEAYANKYIFDYVGMGQSGFLPSPSVYSNIAPTWVDNSYRHEQIQGAVSDENAYALGGISGHAGLFSTVIDTIKITNRFMFASPNDSWINSTTFKYFSTIKNVTQSSRALGWDTNNYKMNTYRGCGNMSQTTWTHTGYTGTQICGDPERKIVAILLTNRCYPDATKTLPDIKIARQEFSNALVSVFDNPTY
eukprot:TRINITY_DN8066_c0_g1_i1.p1 TRINITY_DN8066_c0_g1~~TRINITY_DN8066_c0_g1_i1.p1  ORF type:complete len:433 (-),score=78.97 TRINITY_DN8066_c0_g1_i1:48-1346(-)